MMPLALSARLFCFALLCSALPACRRCSVFVRRPLAPSSPDSLKGGCDRSIRSEEPSAMHCTVGTAIAGSGCCSIGGRTDGCALPRRDRRRIVQRIQSAIRRRSLPLPPAAIAGLCCLCVQLSATQPTFQSIAPVDLSSPSSPPSALAPLPAVAMVFVVRVRDPLGMHRLVFVSSSATWGELQQQVEDVTRVPMHNQLLSRKPLHQPQYVEAQPNTALDKLAIANGDVLYLGGHTPATLAAHSAAAAAPAPAPGAAAASSSSASTSASAASSSIASGGAARPATAPSHKLTPRCQHGPRGACPYCLGVEPGMENKVQGKCNHGPNATCIHCSKVVKEQSKGQLVVAVAAQRGARRGVHLCEGIRMQRPSYSTASLFAAVSPPVRSARVAVQPPRQRVLPEVPSARIGGGQASTDALRLRPEQRPGVLSVPRHQADDQGGQDSLREIFG